MIFLAKAPINNKQRTTDHGPSQIGKTLGVVGGAKGADERVEVAVDDFAERVIRVLAFEAALLTRLTVSLIWSSLRTGVMMYVNSYMFFVAAISVPVE